MQSSHPFRHTGRNLVRIASCSLTRDFILYKKSFERMLYLCVVFVSLHHFLTVDLSTNQLRFKSSFHKTSPTETIRDPIFASNLNLDNTFEIHMKGYMKSIPNTHVTFCENHFLFPDLNKRETVSNALAHYNNYVAMACAKPRSLDQEGNDVTVHSAT